MRVAVPFVRPFTQKFFFTGFVRVKFLSDLI